MRHVAYLSVILLASGMSSVLPTTPTAFFEALGDFAAISTEISGETGVLVVNAILPAREPDADVSREHDFVNSHLYDFIREYPGIFRREYVQ